MRNSHFVRDILQKLEASRKMPEIRKKAISIANQSAINMKIKSRASLASGRRRLREAITFPSSAKLAFLRGCRDSETLKRNCDTGLGKTIFRDVSPAITAFRISGIPGIETEPLFLLRRIDRIVPPEYSCRALLHLHPSDLCLSSSCLVFFSSIMQ